MNEVENSSNPYLLDVVDMRVVRAGTVHLGAVHGNFGALLCG